MSRRRADIRNLISIHLFRRGWTDADLARLTGLARSRINRLKNHRITPTLRDALLISDALSAPVEAIFERAAPLHEIDAG